MYLRAAIITVMLFGQGLGLVMASPVLAVSAPGLELTELLPDPAAPLTDAKDEFVKLHNAGATTVALAGHSLRIGTKQYPLAAGSLAPGSYLVVTSAQASWSLVNTGGTIALLNASGVELESTTWPQAVTGAAWTKAASGTWAWASAPSKGAPSSTVNADDPAADSAPAEVEINELLPDPASPLTDAKDEYVEIYNPNSFPVNLAKYTVKTGANLSTKHTLSNVVVPAAGYAALTSGTTKIALSNSGSSVALFNPAGVQVGPTITYAKAKSGEAWGRFNDHWAWTTTPTAGEPNILSEPAASGVKSATTSKTSAPKTSTAASKAKAGTTKTSTTKAASSTKAAPKSPAPLLAAANTSSGHWLLFALAGLTIAYIIYEFRYDVRNLYFRLRGHPGRGPASGETAPGRGSN